MMSLVVLMEDLSGLQRPDETCGSFVVFFMEPGEGPVVLRLSCLWGSREQGSVHSERPKDRLQETAVGASHLS